MAHYTKSSGHRQSEGSLHQPNKPTNARATIAVICAFGIGPILFYMYTRKRIPFVSFFIFPGLVHPCQLLPRL